MPSSQSGCATDRDVAHPVLLGIYPHREATECLCVAPDCEDRAIGFATFLYRGIMVLPVCHDHALCIPQRQNLRLPADVKPGELAVFAPRYSVVPGTKRGGQPLARQMWTILKGHCA